MRNMKGILVGAALGIGAAYSVGLVVVAIVLMLPGVMAMMLDNTENRLLGRSVLFPCMAASLGPLYNVVRMGGGSVSALIVLGDPGTIALSWGAAGFGWLLVEAVTGLARVILEINVRQRRKLLEEQRDKILMEWGSLKEHI